MVLELVVVVAIVCVKERESSKIVKCHVWITSYIFLLPQPQSASNYLVEFTVTHSFTDNGGFTFGDSSKSWAKDTRTIISYCFFTFEYISMLLYINRAPMSICKSISGILFGHHVYVIFTASSYDDDWLTVREEPWTSNNSRHHHSHQTHCKYMHRGTRLDKV